MAMTLDELLDTVLARCCSECGTDLPVRGGQCQACGTLPAETRPEAEERLRNDPDAFADVARKAARAEAARLREEASGHLAQMRAKFLAADQAVYVAELELAADAAERELTTARAAEQQAAEALRAARNAEEEAAAELADAAQLRLTAQRDEEAARRLRKGPRAEVDAKLRLDAAQEVLGRYQAAHGSLAAVREHAQRQLAAAGAAATSSESALKAARLAVANPGYIPRSAETIANDLTGAVIGGKLNAVDTAIAGVLVRGLFGITGGEDSIRADERRRIAKQEEVKRRHAPQLTANGEGMISAAWAIPPEPSAPVPGGQVTAPPVAGFMSPTAAEFGGNAVVSPGIPGAGQAPVLPKAALPSGQPITDGVWGLTGIGRT